MRVLVIAALLAVQGVCTAGVSEDCATDARERAGKLLSLHFGSDEEFSISEEVTQLPALRNPANKKQMLDVLEVWGFLYKGQYRMRFIYGRIPAAPCTLVGQEIIEFATL